jgi:hypothetical protein
MPAEAPLVSGESAPELNLAARLGREQREDRMGRRPGPQLGRARLGEAAEGTHEVAANGGERLLGRGVVAGRAAQLGGHPLLAGALHPARVLGVDLGPDPVEEGPQAAPRVPLEQLQLVAEDRRQPDRDRLPLEHPE